LIWLRTRTSCGRLWMREWTFGLQKNKGNTLTSWRSVSFSGRTRLQGVSYFVS
jgi:hypothetical protein